MRRVHELVNLLRCEHPSSSFFDAFDATVKTLPIKRQFYKAYERAFVHLDVSSWKNLLDKASRHFNQPRQNQREGALFDQLNDAFAYRWLVRQGFTSVSVLREPVKPEQGKKYPDIQFQAAGQSCICDVKTLWTSQAEYASRKSVKYQDSSRYLTLHPTFFKKIDDAIDIGTKQILAHSQMGVIFIPVNFDDIALTYYKQHRVQIRQHLHRRQILPVVLKITPFGARQIELTQGLASQATA